MKPCDKCTAGCKALPAELQPFGEEYIADGIFVKEMKIPKSGTVVPQHSHVYEHMTLLVKGSVFVDDEKTIKTYHAPSAIIIKAHVKHSFTSLEDNTTLYCIHNTLQTGKVEIAEEHQLAGA